MDEAVFKRIPPHNDEAERAVIGSMMMDQDAVQIASEQLQREDFYNGQYGVIFSALVEMHQQGVGADLVTIQAKLREMEIPPELTSVEYIGDLINSVPTSANVRHYVKIVQEKFVMQVVLFSVYITVVFTLLIMISLLKKTYQMMKVVKLFIYNN